MTEWILLLYLASGDLTPIPGFRAEAACEAAGKKSAGRPNGVLYRSHEPVTGWVCLENPPPVPPPLRGEVSTPKGWPKGDGCNFCHGDRSGAHICTTIYCATPSEE